MSENRYSPPPPPSSSGFNWKSRLPEIILGALLLISVVYGTSVTAEKNNLKNELTSTKSDLSLTQSDLLSTKLTLTSTQADLGATKQMLSSTQTELGSTKQTLATTQTDLASTKQTLAGAQTDLATTKQTLATTQADLGTTRQTLATTQSELGTTKTTLATTNQTLQTTQTILATTNQSLIATQSELGNTRSQLASTQQQLATANTQLQTVTNEKNLMLLQYASLRSSVNTRFGFTPPDRQSFITPSNPTVNRTVFSNWGPPVDNTTKMWQVFDSMYDWTVKNVMYSYDSYVPVLPSSVSGSVTWRSDCWRTPEETLVDLTGDCEDMALLVDSMMVNYVQNKYAIWVVEIQSDTPGTDAHMAVAFPVANGRLSIVDPAGKYFTGMYQYNQLSSDTAASALSEWLSHWSKQIPEAYVSRIFSQDEDESFASNAEFLTWLGQK